MRRGLPLRLTVLAVIALVLFSSVQVAALGPDPAVSAQDAAGTKEEPGYAQYDPEIPENDYNPTWLLLRMFFGLALVLALLVLTGKVLNRRLGVPRGLGRHLTVLDTLPLAPGKGLFLVRAGKRLFLLGVSAEQVTLLQELGPEDFDGGPAEEEPFGQVLAAAVQKAGQGQTASLWQEAAAAIRQQVERLRDKSLR